MNETYIGQGADWIKVAHKYVNNYEFLKKEMFLALELLKLFYERHFISDGILCFYGRDHNIMTKHSQ